MGLSAAWKFLRILPRMLTDSDPPLAQPKGAEPETPFDSLTPRQKVARLEKWGEEAYDRMYDARSPSGEYSEAKDNFHAAIAMAMDLGLTDEAERLEQRLAHIKSVFRSQFS